MKKTHGTVKFRYWKKGDYVITPEGVGIVARDESKIESVNDLIYKDIKVQHKEGTSANTSNAAVSIRRHMVLPLTKEGYEEGL